MAITPNSQNPPQIPNPQEPDAQTALSGIAPSPPPQAPSSGPAPARPAGNRFLGGMADENSRLNPEYTTDAGGNLRRVQSPAPSGKLGVLGEIAMGALQGAVRGLAAQGPKHTFGQALSTGAAGEEQAQQKADLLARAKAEQNFKNQQEQIRTADQHTLALAKIQNYNIQNLKSIHDYNQSLKNDPLQVEIYRAQADNDQLTFQKNLNDAGLTKVGDFKSYDEAIQQNLQKKFGRVQLIAIKHPDGSATVFERNPNSKYAATTAPFEIQIPVGAKLVDGKLVVQYQTTGTIPAGGTTHLGIQQFLIQKSAETAQFIDSWYRAQARQQETPAQQQEINLRNQQFDLAQRQAQDSAATERDSANSAKQLLQQKIALLNKSAAATASANNGAWTDADRLHLQELQNEFTAASNRYDYWNNRFNALSSILNKGGKKPSNAAGNNTRVLPNGQVVVTDPNGGVHTFPNQQAADNFKKLAGIR